MAKKLTKAQRSMLEKGRRGDAGRAAYLARKRERLPSTVRLQEHIRDGGRLEDLIEPVTKGRETK